MSYGGADSGRSGKDNGVPWEELHMTRKPDRFDQLINKLVAKYTAPYNKQATFTPGAVIKLLRAEHRRIVKLIRKRGNEYMRDASDPTLAKSMQACAASKAWAFKDFADEMAALTYLKGGR